MQQPAPGPYSSSGPYGAGRPAVPGVGPPNTVNVNIHHYPAMPPAPAEPKMSGAAIAVHLMLTILTLGTWAPFWIIHWLIVNSTKRTTSRIPGPPPVPLPYQYPAGPPPRDSNQEALAFVAWQRSRRAEARRLAASDPMAARELRIGRRDIPNRSYDDGGLIDINRVSAYVFTHFSGITAEKASGIESVRDRVGTFSSVEDFMTIAEIPPQLHEELTEYVVIIP